MRSMISGLVCALALGLSPAVADQPVNSAVKAEAVKKPAKTADAVQPAPLNPKWVVGNWKISGLTVWTYTPGHFQRN